MRKLEPVLFRPGMLLAMACVGFLLLQTAHHFRTRVSSNDHVMQSEPAVQPSVQASPDVSRARSETQRDEYLSNCRKACVPVPPPLAAKGRTPGRWQGPFSLEGAELLLLSNYNSYVWTYKEAAATAPDHCHAQPGFCVAMARHAPGLSVQQSSIRKAGEMFGESFVGTICSNAQQDTACFFDNLVYDDKGVRQLALEESLAAPYTSLVHPKDYSNQCSMCHVGQNPFLLKPHSDLGRHVRAIDGYIDPLKPRDYSPGPRDGYKIAGFGTGASAWTLPPMMKFAEGLESACAGCHALPAITTPTGRLSSYCNAVLRPSAQTTMPPCDPHFENCKNNGAGWHKVNPWRSDPAILPIYAQSIARLRAECGDDK